MPVTLKKVNGFQVSTPGGVKAKGTTEKKAKAQGRLLKAIERGFKPTKGSPGPLQRLAQKGTRKGSPEEGSNDNIFKEIRKM